MKRKRKTGKKTGRERHNKTDRKKKDWMRHNKGKK